MSSVGRAGSLVAVIRCVAVSVLALIANDATCAVTVAGKTANEIFQDKRVADLAQSASLGHVREVQRLVAEGVPVDTKGYRNATPLAFAVLAPNFSGAEALLNAGASAKVDLEDPDYVSGLPLVLLLGNMHRADLLRLLLDHGANSNAKFPPRSKYFEKFPYEGDSLLIQAVLGHDLESVKVVVEHGADVNYRPQAGERLMTNLPGISAAEFAVDIGQLDITEYLLDHGCTSDLDAIANALQGRMWSAEFRPKRIALLRKLHAMGAHIYSGYVPRLNPSKQETYPNTDTPTELIEPGYFHPDPYRGNTPVTLNRQSR